jgi:hypothetical protein
MLSIVFFDKNHIINFSWKYKFDCRGKKPDDKFMLSQVH